MDFTTSALIASWTAIALLALVVSGLVRQVHQLSRAQPHRPGRAGIAPGAPAPGLDTARPDDTARLDGLLTPGRPALLLFLDADCGTCVQVLAEAGAWTIRQGLGQDQGLGRDQGRGRDQRDPGQRDPVAPQVVALYAGPAPQSGEGTVPVRGGHADLFTAYDIPATPYAVAIDAEGRIARSEPLGSPTALLRLLDDIHPATPRSLR